MERGGSREERRAVGNGGLLYLLWGMDDPGCLTV